jgi:hypothetical protein
MRTVFPTFCGRDIQLVASDRAMHGDVLNMTATEGVDGPWLVSKRLDQFEKAIR